ncbi:4'-phosphopantetheinyl transferase family protein [Streptomyces sp. NPDC048225]|uniref:4'-phosphopantetheinyl transferase family protein n=1 Tax=Streptomyces sp. NPDC048225 TaxID=3365518 RepID=UPI00371820BB
MAVVPIDDILASAAVLDRLWPEERAAVGAMAPWRAREHLAGRALLRLLLTGPLGEAGARSPLVPEPGGRPRLPGFPRTGVSVSHSGPYVAAAVATGLDVGVDVQTPQEPSPGMLRRCCSPRTAARLAKLPPDRAARAFAEVWTVQEACVKANGTGLSGAPWRLPAEPGRPSGAWGGLRWQRLPWPATADPRHAAALAVAFGTPSADDGPPTPPSRSDFVPGPTPHSNSVSAPTPHSHFASAPPPGRGTARNRAGQDPAHRPAPR